MYVTKRVNERCEEHLYNKFLSKIIIAGESPVNNILLYLPGNTKENNFVCPEKCV